MKLSYRSFPYPVLSSWSDDISPQSLEVTYGELDYDKTYYYLPYKIELENESILHYIETGKAGYAIHVECRNTFYREMKWIDEPQGRLRLDGDNLDGIVDVHTFICARCDIDDYSPSGLHDDYLGVNLSLNSGDFIAVGPAVRYDAIKVFDPIQKISSIVSFKPDHDRDYGNILVEPSGDKLIALIPKKIHSKYEQMKIDFGTSIPSVLSTLLVLPVLIEGCDFVKKQAMKGGSGYEECLELRWVRVLERKCKELNLDLLEDTNHIIAQSILNEPYTRACNELMSKMKG